MAAIILLEDGRGLYGSSLGVSSMLALISEEISLSSLRFKSWLIDKSNRLSPFMDFDLRGISEADRIEFWVSAERALKKLAYEYGIESSWPENLYSGHLLLRLLAMHKSITAGESPSSLNDMSDSKMFDGVNEDLDEIWFEND